jgi:hypothetical protein
MEVLVALVCLYCNSVLTPDPETGAPPPTCPRCDARLPTDASIAVRSGSPPPAAASVAPNGSGKTRTLLVLLGMMALIAIATAIYIYCSQYIRRGHDFKNVVPAPSTPAPPTAAPPADRPLVGWLPARCNVVGAVHVADLRSNPAANRALLAKEGSSRIASLGKLLEAQTGLTLDDLDEVVAGIETAGDFPKLYVLLRTRKAYDPAAVLKLTDRTKAETVRGRPVGRFSAFNIVEGLVWPIDERMLAIVLRVQPGPLVELESIPQEPREKMSGSSETLRKLVAELPGQSLAWMAGDVAKDSLFDLLSVFQARTDGMRSLLEAKAFRVSLTADADVTLQGAFLMPSTKAMDEAKPKLEALDWRGPKSLKIETSPADAAPWVFVQARYDDAGIRAVMQSAIGAKEP